MSDRKLRINERMRQVLGEAVGRLEDPRLGFVTITGVRIANDFHNAKVYVSVLGSEDDREDSLAALRSAHGLLQRAVGRDTRLHHTPKLEFIYDDTTDTALRLETLLRESEPLPGDPE